MPKEIEYSVTKFLPDDKQRVFCFGHRTFCCALDMEENPEWHEVVFRLRVCSYRLKSIIPEDPEETILEKYEVIESWECVDDDHERIIGVLRWKYYED